MSIKLDYKGEYYTFMIYSWTDDPTPLGIPQAQIKMHAIRNSDTYWVATVFARQYPADAPLYEIETIFRKPLYDRDTGALVTPGGGPRTPAYERDLLVALRELGGRIEALRKDHTARKALYEEWNP